MLLLISNIDWSLLPITHLSVYTPFHSVCFYSIVDEPVDQLKNADVA